MSLCVLPMVRKCFRYSTDSHFLLRMLFIIALFKGIRNGRVISFCFQHSLVSLLSACYGTESVYYLLRSKKYLYREKLDNFRSNIFNFLQWSVEVRPFHIFPHVSSPNFSVDQNGLQSTTAIQPLILKSSVVVYLLYKTFASRLITIKSLNLKIVLSVPIIVFLLEKRLCLNKIYFKNVLRTKVA